MLNFLIDAVEGGTQRVRNGGGVFGFQGDKSPGVAAGRGGGRGISTLVATRSFIEAGSSLARALPKDRVAAGALPLKTVYDLAAKTRFSLRFNCKKSPPKVIQSTIYLQSTAVERR